MKNYRLDVYLHDKGYADSREKSKQLILNNSVYVDDKLITKASYMVNDDINIKITNTLNYVSRGYIKIEKAVQKFNLNIKNKTAADIGASTGGFTDCMLQNGAVKVYSVDVGHGQLDWKLRNDARVVCMERTNFRYLTPEDINDKLDFASVDVSFISLNKILIPARELLTEDGEMVCLIKPQFEAGRDKVGKKGVVREPKIHLEVIRDVIEFALAHSFYVKNLDFSPIKGPEGNIEYLMHIQKSENAQKMCEITPEELVKLSHGELDK